LKSLFAAQVTLSRFDGNMAQQELDLVEFATSDVTEPGARPAAVMRLRRSGEMTRSRSPEVTQEARWAP
jgi:hypothetical protein